MLGCFQKCLVWFLVCALLPLSALAFFVDTPQYRISDNANMTGWNSQGYEQVVDFTWKNTSVGLTRDFAILSPVPLTTSKVFYQMMNVTTYSDYEPVTGFTSIGNNSVDCGRPYNYWVYWVGTGVNHSFCFDNYTTITGGYSLRYDTPVYYAYWVDVTSNFTYTYMANWSKPYTYSVRGVSWLPGETKRVEFLYRDGNRSSFDWDAAIGNISAGTVDVYLDPWTNSTLYTADFTLDNSTNYGANFIFTQTNLTINNTPDNDTENFTYSLYTGPYYYWGMGVKFVVDYRGAFLCNVTTDSRSDVNMILFKDAGGTVYLNVSETGNVSVLNGTACVWLAPDTAYRIEPYKLGAGMNPYATAYTPTVPYVTAYGNWSGSVNGADHVYPWNVVRLGLVHNASYQRWVSAGLNTSTNVGNYTVLFQGSPGSVNVSFDGGGSFQSVVSGVLYNWSGATKNNLTFAVGLQSGWPAAGGQSVANFNISVIAAGNASSGCACPASGDWWVGGCTIASSCNMTGGNVYVNGTCVVTSGVVIANCSAVVGTNVSGSVLKDGGVVHCP